ncbi:MAG: hypothetical protein ACOVLK_04000 [Terrimicrobiaceae bacterium]|jgi:uncharacterized protein YbaR (Trm112 family)
MSQPDYSDLLVCPQTLKKLRHATEAELEALRKREDSPGLEGAWIRDDRAIAYPVQHGIPLLVATSAIALRKPRAKKTSLPTDQ